MIQEVIRLGIKGSDVVASQLKKIQAEKKKTVKAVDIRVGMTKKVQAASTGAELAAARPGEAARQEKFARDARKDISGAAQGAVSGAVQGLASGSASGAVGGVASSVGGMAGGWGAMLGSLVSPLMEMGKNFAQSIQGALDTVAANAKAVSEIAHAVESTAQQREEAQSRFERNTQIGFNARSGKSPFERTDMQLAKYAADIITPLGQSMGKFTDEYRRALVKLIGTDADRFDAEQSKQIAQGKFSALGTDKGYFLEKIAAGFQGMPPSVRQKLTSQLYEQVSPEERDIQTDFESRAGKAAMTGADLTNATKTLYSDRDNLARAVGEKATAGERDAQMVQLQGDTAKGLRDLNKWLEKLGDRVINNLSRERYRGGSPGEGVSDYGR